MENELLNFCIIQEDLAGSGKTNKAHIHPKLQQLTKGCNKLSSKSSWPDNTYKTKQAIGKCDIKILNTFMILPFQVNP